MLFRAGFDDPIADFVRLISRQRRVLSTQHDRQQHSLFRFAIFLGITESFTIKNRLNQFPAAIANGRLQISPVDGPASRSK